MVSTKHHSTNVWTQTNNNTNKIRSTADNNFVWLFKKENTAQMCPSRKQTIAKSIVCSILWATCKERKKKSHTDRVLFLHFQTRSIRPIVSTTIPKDFVDDGRWLSGKKNLLTTSCICIRFTGKMKEKKKQVNFKSNPSKFPSQRDVTSGHFHHEDDEKFDHFGSLSHQFIVYYSMARELRTARVQRTYRALYERRGDFFMTSLSDVDS